MNNDFLDITSKDINSLSPECLRDLIGRLCEADLEEAGISKKHVRYGGNLNAADGGLDVVVEYTSEIPEDSYIPNRFTGFQAKATGMSAAKIRKEMKPLFTKGKGLNQIGLKQGAYVIVSSADNTSNKMYNDRLIEMKKILKENGHAQIVQVDFYDSQKIASWVNKYPSTILWLKRTIGKPISGWQPYGNWADLSASGKSEFFLDDQTRIRDLNFSSDDLNMTVREAIIKLRQRLKQPGTSIRIVGLSGVGKTRFVEALFDESIETNALNSHTVCYAPSMTDVEPSPVFFLESMITQNRSGYLVVDNCSTQEHKKLTDLIQKSKISLVTIDYDIQEDVPERTGVIEIETLSLPLLSKVIHTKYPNLRAELIRQISEISDGNARLGLAIAEGVEQSSSVGRLRPKELFDRLFWQRGAFNPNLQRTAYACSLVFSFLDKPNEGGVEVSLLADIAGQDILQFIENVKALEQRKLIQVRGYWKALLPHAMANRLAAESLSILKLRSVDRILSTQGAERLLMSMYHRLSYLHDVAPARDFAREKLNQFQYEDLNSVNGDYKRKLLSYLLLTNLDAGLQFLSKLAHQIGKLPISTSTFNWVFTELRTLAYFPGYFIRALKEMEGLASKSTQEDNRLDQDCAQFFRPFLPMTQATFQVRAEYISEAFNSLSNDSYESGIKYLEASLMTRDFISPWVPNIGAYPLDYGSIPQRKSELTGWYSYYFDFATNLISTGHEKSNEIMELLISSFRGLWETNLIDDKLYDWFSSLIDPKSRAFGWRSIIIALNYDGKKMIENKINRTVELEKIVRPKNTIEEIYAYIGLSPSIPPAMYELFIDSDRDTDPGEKYKRKLHEIGQKTAIEPQLLDEVGDFIFNFENYHIGEFIEGLVLGSKNPLQSWEHLLNSFKASKLLHKNYGVLVMFIEKLEGKDKVLAANLKQAVFDDETLRIMVPSLLLNELTLTHNVNQLIDWINSKMNPFIRLYKLGSIKIPEEISALNFCRILKNIASDDKRIKHSLEILAMQFGNEEWKLRNIPACILKTGQDVLIKFLESVSDPFSGNGMEDFYVSRVLERLFKHDFPGKNTDSLVFKIIPSSIEGLIQHRNHQETMDLLGDYFPDELLTIVFERLKRSDPFKDMYLLNSPENIGALFRNVKTSCIRDWYSKNPMERASFIAYYFSLVQTDAESKMLNWTEFGKQYLIECSSIPRVLEGVLFRLDPGNRSGDRSSTLRTYIPLFESVRSWGGESLTTWAEDNLHRLNAWIIREQESEEDSKKWINTFEPW